jgi:hypothetical protein
MTLGPSFPSYETIDQGNTISSDISFWSDVADDTDDGIVSQQ